MKPARAFAVLAALLWCGVAAAASYKPPLNALGQPDLEGIWSSNSLTRLERPSVFPSLVITEAQARALKGPAILPQDEVGGIESEWFDDGLDLARVGNEIRTSWIVDPSTGQLPYTPEGRARLAKPYTYEGPETRSLTERCVVAGGAGPPMLNGIYNNHWQIVQTPDHFLIHLETNHEARVVRIGDRRHGPPQIRKWMGDSIGWWDGDSFVIETTNFPPAQSLRRFPLARLYLSSDAVVVERLTRISATQLLYEFAVTDPATFTRPWRAEMPLNAARGPIYEYACHEGNYSLPGILAGARRVEAEAAVAAK